MSRRHENNFTVAKKHNIFIVKIFNDQDKKGIMEELTNLGRRLSDATLLMHEAIARSVGLSGVDHKYLSMLLRRGRLTAGELSQVTGLTTGAVTALIDRLEKKDLVKREADKNDRRKIYIVPNLEKTNRLFEKSHLDLQERISQFSQGFHESELKVVEKYLSGSIDIMNDITSRLNKNK